MTDQHQTEAQRLAALLRSRNNNQAGFGLGPVCDEAALELLRLNAVHTDLECVKMQLAACGVVAMADTPDSAKKARTMHPDYESASCDDVKRRVDECIELRARVVELEDVLTNLPLSSPQRLRARIQQLEEMLAAVGAGGIGPLIPRSRPDDVALPRTLVAAVINTLIDSKTDDDFQRGREEWAIERLVEAMGDQILQTTEQPSAAEKAPEAWMHTDSRGEKQAFTSEPPPGLKAKCQALYPGQPQQEPLADEQWLKRWTGRTGRRLKPGPERDRLLRIFRFAEHAHGIGGKA